jgi:hypothetical protein
MTPVSRDDSKPWLDFKQAQNPLTRTAVSTNGGRTSNLTNSRAPHNTQATTHAREHKWRLAVRLQFKQTQEHLTTHGHKLTPVSTEGGKLWQGDFKQVLGKL